MCKLRILQSLFLLVITLAAGLPPAARAGTHTWTGGGANEFWNTAANWTGGAPTAGEAAPVTLVFPGGVTTTNNVVGLTVDSIVFNGDGAVLHGSGGGTLIFRGAGGTNLLTTSSLYASNTLASTLPVTMNGSNYFRFGVSYHDLAILGVVSGSGGLAIDGLGSIFVGGSQANTVTGTLLILNATLYLSKPAGVNAWAGPLELRTGLGFNSVRLVNANQIPDSSLVTLRSNCSLDMSADEGLANLTLNGGHIGSGTGLLTLLGNVTVTGNSFIDSRTSLGGATRTFNVSGGVSLEITGVITNGSAAAGLTKTGAGTLKLSGTNNFTGAVLVSGGTLLLKNDAALGSSAGGVTVNGGCTLQLQDVDIVGEALTLSGNLTATGTNSWSGTVSIPNEISMDIPDSTQFTLSGVMSGAGPVQKTGAGTLVLSGASGNTHSGGIQVSGGTLSMSKTSGSAFLGPLTVESGATARLLAANQIGNNSAVTVNTGGTLHLNNFSDGIGSLTGNGSVSLGSGTLTNGFNGASTTFSGVISGSGITPIVKTGGGQFTLTATNTCTGINQCIGGDLQVNGSLPGPVIVSGGGGFSGSGQIGNLSSASGNINPGAGFGIGKVTVASLALTNAATSVAFDISGTTPGTDYDQISVNGTVTLNNPTLMLLRWTAGGLGHQHVLIANDGADAVVGTFNGLPEGATIYSGLVQYTISYHGGTGNDVVLTQAAAPPAPRITSITKGAGGVMNLTGNGPTNAVCNLQAKQNLNSTNWVDLGSVNANGAGVINFTDEDAPLYTNRFYRLFLP